MYPNPPKKVARIAPWHNIEHYIQQLNQQMQSIQNNIHKIEPQSKGFTQPIIYKYRDWENESHKRIITNNEVWFAIVV